MNSGPIFIVVLGLAAISPGGNALGSDGLSRVEFSDCPEPLQEAYYPHDPEDRDALYSALLGSFVRMDHDELDVVEEAYCAAGSTDTASFTVWGFTLPSPDDARRFSVLLEGKQIASVQLLIENDEFVTLVVADGGRLIPETLDDIRVMVRDAAGSYRERQRTRVTLVRIRDLWQELRPYLSGLALESGTPIADLGWFPDRDLAKDDAWGNPIVLYSHPGFFALCSAGADGTFEERPSPGQTTDPESDIIWTHKGFWRVPEGFSGEVDSSLSSPAQRVAQYLVFAGAE